MYIVKDACNNYGTGETIEKAIEDFEDYTRKVFDPDYHHVYKVEEIKVKREFKIVEVG